MSIKFRLREILEHTKKDSFLIVQVGISPLKVKRVCLVF